MALLIYAGAAAVAIILLVVTITSDRYHDEDQVRERMLIVNEERAHFLGRHLALLATELRRLGLRSEVNLLDDNMAPEKSLLELSHGKSTFFNLGVAILGRTGSVVWREPADFLPLGTSFAKEPWFAEASHTRALGIVPVDPASPIDAVLYVVSPIIRNDEFVGTLIGGVDLARQGSVELHEVLSADVQTMVVTHDGTVVFPAREPDYATGPAWRKLFAGATWDQPTTLAATLGGGESVVAVSPIADTELALLTVAERSALMRPARNRMLARLGLGLGLALAPLALLVFLLRRSLRLFRAAEGAAARDEQLARLGEAANHIAHEIKNSLNGLKLGLDVAFRERTPSASTDEESRARKERVVIELRSEIQRLSEFTSELMLFSKGVVPRKAALDLGELIPKVTSLAKDAAADHGIALDLALPAQPVRVVADPALVHIVISNLVSNAIDALSGQPGARPRVEVRVGSAAGHAEVAVSDNGPGVPAELRHSLFEPFVTGKPSGVGIGLALSHKIAVAHGGNLTLQDSTSGATFLLTLPLESA